MTISIDKTILNFKSKYLTQESTHTPVSGMSRNLKQKKNLWYVVQVEKNRVINIVPNSSVEDLQIYCV